MEQINVAMNPEVLAGIVRQLGVIDQWLTLKTEPVLNGTLGPHLNHELRNPLIINEFKILHRAIER